MIYKIVRFLLAFCYVIYVISEIFFLITYDYNTSVLGMPIERLDINLSKIFFSTAIAINIFKRIINKFYVVSLMGISTTFLVDMPFGLGANGSILDLLEFVEIISILLLIFFIFDMERKNKLNQYKSTLKLSFIYFTGYWFLSKILMALFITFT